MRKVLIEVEFFALGELSLPPSSKRRRGFGLKNGESLKLQRRYACREEKRITSLPTIEFFGRKGLEEFGPDRQLTLQNTELSAALAGCDRNQPYYRIFAKRNNDLLSGTCFFDEPREVGFGFVDADGFHMPAQNILANDGRCARLNLSFRSPESATEFAAAHLTPARNSHTAARHRVRLAARRGRRS